MNDQVPYQTLEIKQLENRIKALEALLTERRTGEEQGGVLPTDQAKSPKTAAKGVSEDTGRPDTLQENEIRYRHIFEHSPLGIFRSTLDGRILMVNKELSSFCGYSSPKDFIAGCRDLEQQMYVHPDARKELIALLQTNGTVRDFQCQIRKNATETAWVSINARLTGTTNLTGGQSPPVIDGFAIDITERKQTEQALRESDENFRSFTESSPDAIVRYDQEGRHLYLNSAAVRLLGQTNGAPIGQPVRSIGLSEGQSRFLQDSISRVFRTAQPYQTEMAWNNEHATLLFDWRFSPEFDGFGRVRSVLAVSRDRTERRRIENVQTFLAQTSTGLAGEPFFHALARYLAENLDMQFVCIDQLEGDGLSARTVAVWNDGAFEDNITYSLADTPCGEVVGKTICCFPADVRHRFPRDQVLQDLQAESYAGVTLWDHAGQPIGLIAVIGRNPLANQPLAETILQLVAVRAAGELERLRVQETLQTTLKRFQIILSSLYPGLLVVSDAGRVEFVNQSFCDLFALKKSPEDLIGMAPSDLIKSRIKLYVKPRKALARIRKILEERTPIREEEVAIRGQRTFLRDFIPIDIDGKQFGRLWHHYDITEHKRTVAALRESEQHFRSYFDMGLIGMATLSTDKRWIHFNDRLCEMLGYPREELAQKTWDELTHPDDLPADLLRFEKIMLGTTDTFATEKRYLRKDGRVVHTEASSRCIRNGDGSINHFVTMVQDITPKKQAQEKARALQTQLLQGQKLEAIGTLAGGIAHDFNNILAAVIGYTDMARDLIPSGSPLANDLDQVLKAGHRAKDLVKQILVFSRQAETEPITLFPANIVKEVITLLRPSLPSTIAIEQRIDPQAGPVCMDPTQLHQILMNLCTNAFHAMEEDGGILSITLKTASFEPDTLPVATRAQPGRYIQLKVSDTGIGIPAGIRDRIFDPFFTTKEMGKGTGMGLSIIHGIVTGYQGFITFDSGPGRGSAFYIYLPVASPSALIDQAKAEPLPVGSEHILFIDDEEILTTLAETMLARMGYRVTVQSSSLEALNTFQNAPERFDLVITDQTMPDMTGMDLARRMLQIRPDLPIILCTGYSSILSEEKAKAIGIRGFALKPLTKQDLALLIRKVLSPL